MKKNNNNLILFSILTILFLLRFIFFKDTILFGGDQTDHLEFTQSIAVNSGYIWYGAKAFSKICQDNLTEVFLGPFYYYLLFIPSLITKWSPFGASVFNNLLGGISIYLIYYLGCQISSKKVGAISAIFYGVSMAVIIFNRTIWNPYFLPFFVLLEYISLLKIIQGRNKYLILLFLTTALTTQLHGLTFLLIPGIMASLFIYKVKIPDRALWWKSFTVATMVYLPLIYHEITNKFENTRSLIRIVFYSKYCEGDKTSYLINLPHTIKAYFDSVVTTLNGRVYESVWTIWNSAKFEKTFTYFIFGYLIISFILLFINLVTKKTDKKWWIPLLIIIFYLLGSNLFPSNTYPYYYIALLPLSLMILAYPLALISQKKFGNIIAIIVIIVIAAINLFSFTKYIQARHHRRTTDNIIFADLLLEDQLKLVEYIYSDSKGKSFDMDYKSQYDGDAFRYINVYDYLLRRKGLTRDPSAKISYLVLVPRTTEFSDRIINKKVLEDKTFGSVRVIKYEKQI